MRRNLFLLTCCQAIGQAGNVIMLSATALSVITFFPNRDLATLPATLQHVGVMLAVFPAAAIMMRMGRGFGFRVGSVFGMAGAVIAGMVAYGTMLFVMSASPLAIVGCGLLQTEAPWVIFLHVMGMFVPSFFTGGLITRYGVMNVMFAGAVILLAGVLVALDGMTVWHFRISLALNGVGWNFLFVGATMLVTTCYRPSERGKAQALNDFLIFSTSASSSFLAGFLQERLGWITLNWASLALIAVAFFAVIWLRLQRAPVPA